MSMMVGHSRYGSKDHCCGIEVTNNLNWEHWEPGGEYTQKLILKNVNVKTKKLKYRLRSRFLRFVYSTFLFEYYLKAVVV